MILLQHLKDCPSINELPKSLDLNSKMYFCTDTRKFKKNSAFVAIPGAKVNPLNMIDALLAEGCPLVFYQASDENAIKVKKLSLDFPGTKFLSVNDSVIFLQELSHHHIQYWKKLSSRNTVFAISGSNGKTTHKEMLSHILKSIRPQKIIATEKNNNNHLGVPLTLLEVSEETEMVVLELGSNHPGEIKVLCDIAQPNAGLTTNIGATHLEFFGSEKNVFDEEGYLYHAVKNITKGSGFYLINKDDPFLKNLEPFPAAVSYGESVDASARISFLENGAEIVFDNTKIAATNEYITGRHNKLNLITCVFIACHFYPELKSQIQKAASEFRPTKNRSEWIDFEGKKIYLDAYNANPSSMKAALEGYKESLIDQGLALNDACVVLGDMNELGETTPLYHQDVAAFAHYLGFNNIYFVGRFSQHYLKGFPGGKGRSSTAEFKAEFRSDVLNKYRIHFIKGSRSLQLESLFDIT
jgi:UDP-N-acetylmuramoyl-tripeptide--D-alanyl-D-alanine ligase